MKFSQLDVIGLERGMLLNKKELEGARVWSKLLDVILNPRNPKHTFTFYVPTYLYIRSVSFCEDIAAEINEVFTPGHLAKVLYVDFLSYFIKNNNIHDIYSKLIVRDLSPATIRPWQTDGTYKGVIFEEVRGFEMIKVRLDHRLALKGEFLLRDMLEIYQDHTFTLESILEIVYCDFVEDYRKGLIKNPINKILQYFNS